MDNRFRVWDGEKMWYNPYIQNNGGRLEWLLAMDGTVKMYRRDPIGPDGNYLAVVAGGIPLFSTGHKVKDKDGNERELYEGDIVERIVYKGMRGDDEPWEKPERIKGKFVIVRKPSGEFLRRLIRKGSGFVDFQLYDYDTTLIGKLIGNRYELSKKELRKLGMECP